MRLHENENEISSAFECSFNRQINNNGQAIAYELSFFLSFSVSSVSPHQNHSFFPTYYRPFFQLLFTHLQNHCIRTLNTKHGMNHRKRHHTLDEFFFLFFDVFDCYFGCFHLLAAIKM